MKLWAIFVSIWLIGFSFSSVAADQSQLLTRPQALSQALCEDNLLLGPNGLPLSGATFAPATFINPVNGELTISHQALIHGGKPVDTKKFKYSTLVERTSRVGADDASITVKNFKHDDKFYTAKISLSAKAIHKAILQKQPFPIMPGIMAGHVQARFIMNSGYEIQLFDPETGEAAGTVRDMVVSYEAVQPPGGTYNFAFGAFDVNPLVGRLVSGEQRYSEGRDRITPEADLPFNGLENAQLLSHYIEDSLNIKMDLFYNTIIRNCTTKIFDGIDKIASVQKTIIEKDLPPFLTSIGGDPVIGPTDVALWDRFGSSVILYRGMKEEYETGEREKLGPLQKPTIDERMPFAPGGDAPMNMLIVTKGAENLSQDQQKLLDEVIDDIIRDLPETMNMMMASAFSLAEDVQAAPQVIGAITEVITKKLNARIIELDGKLPREAPLKISLLFTPYETDEQVTDLREIANFRAQLPFAVQRLSVTRASEARVEEEIQHGIETVDDHVEKGLPAFLKSMGVHIQLQQDNSNVNTQVLIGLQPMQQGMEIKNDQVELDQFSIPTDDSYIGTWSERWLPWKNGPKPQFVNMLLSHGQDLALDGSYNPNASIRFGANPAVIRGAEGIGEVEIPRVTNGKFVCWSGAQPHSPMLSGVFASQPMPNEGFLNKTLNWILPEKRAILSITDLDMNLRELEISTARVRVGALGLRCIEQDSVNEQFGAQANDKLQDILGKIGAASIVLP